MNNQFKTVTEYAQGQEAVTLQVSKIAEFQNNTLPTTILLSAGISVTLIIIAIIFALMIVHKK